MIGRNGLTLRLSSVLAKRLLIRGRLLPMAIAFGALIVPTFTGTSSQADESPAPIKNISVNADQQLVIEFAGSVGSLPNKPVLQDFPGPNHRLVLDFSDAVIDRARIPSARETLSVLTKAYPALKGLRYAALTNTVKPTARIVLDFPEPLKVNPRVVNIADNVVTIDLGMEKSLATDTVSQSSADTASQAATANTPTAPVTSSIEGQLNTASTGIATAGGAASVASDSAMERIQINPSAPSANLATDSPTPNPTPMPQAEPAPAAVAAAVPPEEPKAKEITANTTATPPTDSLLAPPDTKASAEISASPAVAPEATTVATTVGTTAAATTATPAQTESVNSQANIDASAPKPEPTQITSTPPISESIGSTEAGGKPSADKPETKVADEVTSPSSSSISTPTPEVTTAQPAEVKPEPVVPADTILSSSSSSSSSYSSPGSPVAEAMTRTANKTYAATKLESSTETVETKPAMAADEVVPNPGVAVTPATPAPVSDWTNKPETETPTVSRPEVSTPVVASASVPSLPKQETKHQFTEAVSHYNQGYELHKTGKLTAAISEYEAAIAANPNLSQAYSNLGMIYNQQHNYKEALVQFRKALAIDPKDAITYNGIGAALRAQKDMVGAVKNWQTAAALDPKLATAHYNLGTAYEIEREYDKALACYRLAVKNDYRLGEAYYRMGLILQKQNNPQEAVEQFNKALKISTQAEYSTDARQRVALLNQKKVTR